MEEQEQKLEKVNQICSIIGLQKQMDLKKGNQRLKLSPKIEPKFKYTS